MIATDVLLVLLPEQATDCEFLAFDPQLRSFADALESQHATVCGTDYDSRIMGIRHWPGVWFEFAGRQYQALHGSAEKGM